MSLSENNTFNKSIIRAGAFTGIAAGILGSVSDVLLLFVPGADYLGGDYGFLGEISSQRMLAGSLLGVFLIPLLLAGLVPVFVALRPAGKGWAIAAVASGIYLAFPGVAYHGSVAFISEWIRQGDQVPAEVLEHALLFGKSIADPLAVALMLGFLTISILFAILVSRGKTLLPAWQAALNPFSFYTLIFLIYQSHTWIGDFLVVTGFNLSMSAFYLFVWLSLRKKL